MDYIIAKLSPTRIDKQVHDRGILEEKEETEKLRSMLIKV